MVSSLPARPTKSSSRFLPCHGASGAETRPTDPIRLSESPWSGIRQTRRWPALYRRSRVLKGKQELLKGVTKPEGNTHVETDEQFEDFRVVAILNFTRHWTDYDKNAGVSWGITARVTLVLSCK